MPLGAPASNLTGPNFTPPFPAYPSGHAGFGGALFQVLRELLWHRPHSVLDSSRTSSMATPKTTPATCAPNVTRNFRRLSEAEEENGQSRIYLGIHWSFDKTEGIAQGGASPGSS